MANQKVDDDLSLSKALQRVVDSSQHVILAQISSVRLEVKEDLGRAVGSMFVIGAGMILINGAWLSLMAFMLHGLDGQLSLLACLAIAAAFTGLIGAGLTLAGVRRLRRPEVEPDDVAP